MKKAMKLVSGLSADLADPWVEPVVPELGYLGLNTSFSYYE